MIEDPGFGWFCRRCLARFDREVWLLAHFSICPARVGSTGGPLGDAGNRERGRSDAAASPIAVDDRPRRVVRDGGAKDHPVVAPDPGPGGEGSPGTNERMRINAFIEGACWWEWKSRGATMWASDKAAALVEVESRIRREAEHSRRFCPDPAHCAECCERERDAAEYGRKDI